MYEANPMGFLIEEAGGSASVGECSILDIKPHAIHQRVGVVMGYSAEVTSAHMDMMSS
jgi:fructose-1,6-bisphosphatase I